jgi:Flp pilus assembly protein TadD
VDALTNLASLLFLHWEHAEAEALLHTSLTLAPAHPSAAQILGALLERTGRAAEAAPLF